jgi:tripartite-type tricarboxylate transporter receptor subunit TctC
MMKARRRDFLSLAAAAVTLPRLSRAAWALDYPARPVRLIVATGAGGSPDIVARLIGHGCPRNWDNRLWWTTGQVLAPILAPNLR